MKARAYTLKLNLAQLLRPRTTLYTLPLYCSRAYAQKHYATVHGNQP